MCNRQYGPNNNCGSDVATVRALQLLAVRLVLEAGAATGLLVTLTHNIEAMQSQFESLTVQCDEMTRRMEEQDTMVIQMVDKITLLQGRMTGLLRTERPESGLSLSAIEASSADCGRVERLPTVTVKALLVPENSDRPYFVHIRTIDVRFDGKEDKKFGHVPDMRSFWGDEGWTDRRITMNRFDDPAFESRGLNGTYCALRSIAKHHLPPNKHCESGVWGDVCFVKMAGNEWGETGIAQYVDLAANTVDADVVEIFLKALLDV